MTTTDPAEIRITSFGYGHGEPPAAHMTYDVRKHFRDPHVNPALRELTADDWEVIGAVMNTPGIPELITAITAAVTAFAVAPVKEPITVAIGCVGGRHRSAVIANILAATLRHGGMQVTVTHRDITNPVIAR